MLGNVKKDYKRVVTSYYLIHNTLPPKKTEEHLSIMRCFSV